MTADETLGRYFSRRPPFEDARDKKAEFPDAFSLQRLSQWCNEGQRNLIIVSGDKGVRLAAGELNSRFQTFQSLAALLDAASSEARLAEFVRGEVVARQDDIAEDIGGECVELGFYLRDQDGDVTEIEWMDVTMSKEIEIIEMSAESATVQVSSIVKFKATLAYGHVPDDERERSSIYFGRIKEDVIREAKVEATIQVSFQDVNPNAFAVGQVVITEPSGNVPVNSSMKERYRFK